MDLSRSLSKDSFLDGELPPLLLLVNIGGGVIISGRPAGFGSLCVTVGVFALSHEEQANG